MESSSSRGALAIHTESLISEVLAPTRDDSKVGDLAMQFGPLLDAAPASERAAANESLLLAIDRADPSRAAWLAVAAGCLVEVGQDDDPLTARVHAHLPGLLDRAAEFLRLARERVVDPEDDETSDPDDTWFGEARVPGEAMRDIAEHNGEVFRAWNAIPYWSEAAITALSGSTKERERARKRFGIERFDCGDESLMRLRELLAAPDDELFVVVHAPTDRAFRVRVSGTPRLDQLETLLASLLIPPLPGPPPSVHDIAVHDGSGPTRGANAKSHEFGMLPWCAVGHDGFVGDRVPDIARFLTARNGTADLPAFDGGKVLILGPRSKPIAMRTTRLFARLHASVQLVETLSTEQTRALMRRFGAAAPEFLRTVEI